MGSQATRSKTVCVLFVIVGLGGCANEESLIAREAKTQLIGMAEVDLETCLGIPDHEVTRGKTSIFTYNATPARTLSLSIPVVNGVGVSFSGNCRATFRLDGGHVSQVVYSGDSYGFEGPDSTCASIVRAQ